MRTLLAIALTCGCAGSLVDQVVGATGGDGGTPTQACLSTCTSTAVPNAAPLCIGDTCTYECQAGKLKCASGCCDATAISAGASHSCAVAGGEARCWGANDQGQLGRAGASSFVPLQAGGIPSAVTSVAAGSKHSCAIAAGEVWCWGDNTFGQLGNGQSGAGTGSAVPQKVPGLSGIQLIACGGGHTCAADASTTYCWGRGDFGQLGDGSTSSAPQVQPKAVPSLPGIIALALGDDHSCAATGSSMFCWGANGAGQIGTAPPFTPVTSPTSVGVSAKFIGLGANHSCAGDASGALSCWGANASAQIDTSQNDELRPKGVMSGTLAVAGGVGHTCILTNKNGVTCLGANDDGQLGAPGATLTKADVTGLSSVAAIAAGAKHNCALQGGAVLCWGLNDRGQLGGDPAAAATSATPVPVSGR